MVHPWHLRGRTVHRTVPLFFGLLSLVSCSAFTFIVSVSARLASCFLIFQLLPAYFVFLPERF